MANQEQLKVLKQGVDGWNAWRSVNHSVVLDLEGAELKDAHLEGADLEGADLTKANLRGAHLHNVHLREATLYRADLRGACLLGADLYKAKLKKVDLRGANLRMAFLTQADLRGATLRGQNLEQTVLVEARLEGADLTGCYVYGASVWNVGLDEKTKQKNLIVSRPEESTITVDDIEVAQFIYLLRRREKLRNVLDTITSKAVLILGRFTPERKAILDAVAEELRKYDLLPIIFDFERSTARDFTETIKILAGMSLFVIVDITNPKSAPLELEATVPDYQIPFVPIIQEGEEPFSMFSDLRKYGWVLKPLIAYSSPDKLRKNFKKAIMDRAWKKHQKLQKEKTAKIATMSIDDFVKGKREPKRRMANQPNPAVQLTRRQAARC